MFIVQTGAVELFVKDTAGQKIVLHTARARRLLRRALAARRRLSHCERDRRSSRRSLLVLDREDLLQLFRKRPDAALDMLAAMGRMTRKANALLRERVVRNVNEEVAGRARQRRAPRRRLGRELLRQHHVPRCSTSASSRCGSCSISACCRSATSIAFPFGLLTMAVSLEAIILSTLLLFSSNRQGARDRIRSDVEYEINLKAELEVAHLHEKTDRIHEEMLERFTRIEKALGVGARTSGRVLAAANSDPAMPRSGG